MLEFLSYSFIHLFCSDFIDFQRGIDKKKLLTMYETIDGKQLYEKGRTNLSSININCLKVTQMSKIVISGKDENPISTACIKKKKIIHLRGKVEQAVYEMIHTYNVTMLTGEMYRFVL